MATRKIPDLPRSIALALISFATIDVESRRRAGSCLHEDFPADDEISIADVPDASSLASSITLANALKAAWNAHCANTDAHIAADATNVVAAANATNLATVQTLLNELKGDFNAHIAAAPYHHLGGAGGVAAPATVATADASDQTTANALANALKAAFLRHISSGAPTLELVAS